LEAVSKSRNIDSTQLHLLANNGAIQTAGDALKYGLVDSLIYTDQLDNDFHQLLKTKASDKINFISLDKYAETADYKKFSGSDLIAVVYAQGEIVDGGNDNDKITSDKYVNLIRKLRKDSSVKAIVMRVNSPGGSALASDMIWREITLAKKVKPVIISMGDLAASGGYYISCNGSYIFAEPNTITGSIGVFSIVGNAEDFFKNKLGLTFDVVKTGPYADLGSIARPLTQPEKNFMQSSVDSIYKTFTERVAEGRHKTVAYIDSIAQGRVWTGERGLKIGLVDSLGSLNDAIKYAAKLIKSKDYRISEYPEKKSIFDQLFHSDDNNSDVNLKILAKTLGPEMSKNIMRIRTVQTMMNTPQTRLPFEFEIR
jgi:protease-4